MPRLFLTAMCIVSVACVAALAGQEESSDDTEKGDNVLHPRKCPESSRVIYGRGGGCPGPAISTLKNQKARQGEQRDSIRGSNQLLSSYLKETLIFAR